MSDLLSQIDPSIDPSGASSLLQGGLSQPAPVLTVVSNLVTLPGGLRVPGGSTVYKEAEVRELNGEDEEAISKLLVASKNDQVDTVWPRLRRLYIDRGLVSIGPGRPDPRALFLGDRDTILLGIRIATWGPDHEALIQCSGCNEKKDIIFELDKDIKYKTVDDPYETKTVTLRNGAVVVLRRPMVDDQDFAFGDGKGTPAEMKSRLLSKLIVTVNDVDIEVVNPGGALAYTKTLGMKDRSTLAAAIEEMEFGPQLGEVMVTCEDCGTEWVGSLPMSALF